MNGYKSATVCPVLYVCYHVLSALIDIYTPHTLLVFIFVYTVRYHKNAFSF